MDDSEAFGRLVAALQPWLRELVVIGGWAHRLHRLHPLAQAPDHPPLATRDADLAFSDDHELRGDLGRVLKKAGFVGDPRGDDRPPAMHYVLAADDRGFYLEFLTPQRGSERKRGGRRDVTVATAGITAQKLRYLDLLLVAPWSVRLGPNSGLAAKEVAVLVPNPTSFIVQKLLIARRSADKRAQDVLYIHDTLQLFGGALGELAELWAGRLLPAMPAAWARRVRTRARDRFREVDDTIREAARMQEGRTLDARHLREACEYGLEGLLRESAEA